MKQKDYIEELIGKNLEALNDNEPSPVHFKRFEDKLKSSENKRIKNRFLLIGKIAAAAVFILLIVNQAIIWFSPGTEDNSSVPVKEGMTLASVSPHYKEVEFYFTNAINVELNEWGRLKNDGIISKVEQGMMDKELEEFEVVFKKLQNDLADNPNDERVINAMLEYYQTKLSLINMIVDKLQEVKQINIKDHEPEI